MWHGMFWFIDVLFSVPAHKEGRREWSTSTVTCACRSSTVFTSWIATLDPSRSPYIKTRIIDIYYCSSGFFAVSTPSPVERDTHCCIFISTFAVSTPFPVGSDNYSWYSLFHFLLYLLRFYSVSRWKTHLLLILTIPSSFLLRFLKKHELTFYILYFICSPFCSFYPFPVEAGNYYLYSLLHLLFFLQFLIMESIVFWVCWTDSCIF